MNKEYITNKLMELFVWPINSDVIMYVQLYTFYMPLMLENSKFM